MISRRDIQRLIHRPASERPVVSVFLDMSVDSDNKRSHGVFLAQQRSAYAELDSERATHPREALGAVFQRVERWLADGFDEANKGAAVYTELGGDWFESLQAPVPLPNRFVIDDRPVIGPLAEIIERYHHHGVILVDREHLRMFSVYLGRPLHEHEVRTEPYPAPHDVRGGGYSAPDYQRRKAEEVRHFFKEFALEVGEFVRRYGPDDLVLVGTDENVTAFRTFLPKAVDDRVVHTAHGPIDAPVAEILGRLEPFFGEYVQREESDALAMLRDRVGHRHLAAAGVARTLEELQEGKVDTLVLARGLDRTGARCTHCGFYLASRPETCPYCGGTTRDGVDVGEAMIRIAEEQEIPIEFADPQALDDMEGAGALLKF
ncbi:MAG: hypothetical protein ACOC8B_07010 [Gemmatimonadota bacterium]